MLVGRTVGSVQYRYCKVEGCNCATTTFRSDAPHKRWPPAGQQAAERRARGAESDDGTTSRPAGRMPERVNIFPQESAVTPVEWPVGRPVPGQSS